MLLREINDLILERIPSLDKSAASTRATSTSYVNFSIGEVWRASNWEFRKRAAQLLIEPKYSTGTCSILKFNGTNELSSRTVTLSVPLSFNARGHYFKPKNGASLYRVLTGESGSNTLLLETPVLDNSNGSLEFEIWKRFYYLRSEVEVLLDVRNSGRYGSLTFTSSEKTSSNSSTIDETGHPSDYSAFGVSFEDIVSYETGVVTIEQNSNVANFSGANLIGNADVGDLLTVGGNEYTVQRVVSNSQLVLGNYALVAVSGSTFKIEKNNPLAITLRNQSDVYRIMDYTYLSKAPKLLNEDYDALTLDLDYIDAIILNAQAMWLEHKDYQKYTQIFGLYQAKLNGLKLKKRMVNPRYAQFEPYIYPSLPGRI